MPWYHVRVERKDGRIFSEFDRSEDYVNKIVGQYNQGERIYFNQRWINPLDIEVISIFRSIDTHTKIMSDYHQDPEKVFEKSSDVTQEYDLKPVVNTNTILEEQEKQQQKTKDQNKLANDTPIFIVHGRDLAPKDELSNFLRTRLSLQPVAIIDLPSGGSPTVIEKLERYASRVGYCLVLLTPDDVGSLNQEQLKLESRARQNVVLELGYFMAKLGRDKVTCISRGNIEIPSDIDGVLSIRYKEKVSEKFEDIIEELAFVYNIKFHKLDL